LIKTEAALLLVDAHLHIDQLSQQVADLSSCFVPGSSCLASSHSQKTLDTSRALCAKLPSSIKIFLSLGLHPQLPVFDEAEALADAAAAGSISAIGECGFDFFGDTPLRTRTPQNERLQRTIFEYQVNLALRHNLPMVLHLRKATDLIFEYINAMAQLPGLIFHGWTGPPNEAISLLKRCPRALFSFGTGLLNGNKKSQECVRQLPASALLTESDAPFQPPRERPEPGARVIREWSQPDDVAAVLRFMAELRGCQESELAAIIRSNFEQLFKD